MPKVIYRTFVWFRLLQYFCNQTFGFVYFYMLRFTLGGRFVPVYYLRERLWLQAESIPTHEGYNCFLLSGLPFLLLFDARVSGPLQPLTDTHLLFFFSLSMSNKYVHNNNNNNNINNDNNDRSTRNMEKRLW